MKVLWIVNTMFPALSESLGLRRNVSGGWMYSLAEELSNRKEICLAVATVHGPQATSGIKLNGITYFLLPGSPPRVYRRELEPLWAQICSTLNPDLIHIHGTEYTHGAACMRSCRNQKYVISIQGLVSVYARYYLGGMTNGEVFRHITLRDLLRRDTLFQARRKFKQRGIREVECLRSCRHIIGRTSWDAAHSKSLNPGASYHVCNEILRKGFYTARKWNLECAERLSVFVSQASYPLKGVHQVIRAVAMLRPKFPNVELRIAGASTVDRSSLVRRLHISGYESFLRSLIRRLNMEKNMAFLGVLSEAEMITEYQRAHVFVCPSSIENSPNSLGEAQIVGTPCVAAFVGGIPDMITQGKSGLMYRFEEVEMLAHSMECIFNNDHLASALSDGAIAAAEARHNRDFCMQQLLDAYSKVQAEVSI